MTAPIDWGDEPAQPPSCGRTSPHPGHRYMLGRKTRQCPGAPPRSDQPQPGRKLLDQMSDAELTALYERAEKAEKQLTRVRALAADMRTWCSPRGLANHYADTLDAALKEPKEHRP